MAWQDARRHKVTASRLPALLGFYGKAKLDTYMGIIREGHIEGDISKIRNIQRGRQFEAIAIAKMMQDSNATIKPCGFFIDPSNERYGASPDGLGKIWRSYSVRNYAMNKITSKRGSDAMNFHYCIGYEVVAVYAKPHKNGALGMSTFATPGALPFLRTGPFNGRPEGGRLCCQLFENFMKDKKDQASQPSIEVHQELEEPSREANVKIAVQQENEESVEVHKENEQPEHWENGLRKDTNDLPNVAVPSSQVERHRIKYENALRVVNAATNVSAKQRETLKKVKKKYELVMRIASASSRARPERRVLPEQNNGQEASSSTSNLNVGNNNTTLQQHEHHEAQAIADLDKRLKELQDSLKVTEEEKSQLEIRNQELLSVIDKLQGKKFTYINLVKNPQNFSYLTGLTVTQFDLIFTCVEPYIHLIPYPHSKTSGQRSVDTKTELVTVLAICRQSLHFGVMAIMLHKSRITVQRIFTAWVIFLATLFNQVDLKPCGKFLLQKMPKIFKETGHGETDLIIDATEFKFQSASNFELNSLMFSNYKNTVTGKALIGIAPHGMGILFSEIYPGSIPDSEITEKAGALNFVEEEHEVMSDRFFNTRLMCNQRGCFKQTKTKRLRSVFAKRCGFQF
eukprot:gene13250-14612_t